MFKKIKQLLTLLWQVPSLAGQDGIYDVKTYRGVER